MSNNTTVEIPPECVRLESALSAARQDVDRAERELIAAKLALQPYKVGDHVMAPVGMPGESFKARSWQKVEIKGIGLARYWREDDVYTVSYNVRRVLKDGSLAKRGQSVSEVRPLEES